MFFPDASYYKLENLLRYMLFLIITAIFGTLALMVIIGSGVHLLVTLIKNNIANSLNQFMAEINMDDVEEAATEEEKPKMGTGKKGRNARRRKNKMQANEKKC